MKKQHDERNDFPQAGESFLEGRQGMSLMKEYEPPKTTRTEVETEGNFCGSTIKDDGSNSEVTAIDHEVQEYTDQGIEGNPFDFSGNGDNWSNNQ